MSPSALATLLALALPLQSAPEQAAPVRETPLGAVQRAYREGRSEEALVLSDEALLGITRSGDPEAIAPELYFWRGAALRKLGRVREAEVSLRESELRGFREPELALELALVRRSLGQEAKAKEDFRRAKDAVPGDLERQSRFLERWEGREQADPRFRLSLSPQIGYDSNMIGLDPRTPLLQGNVDSDSFFAGLFLDARFVAYREGRQALRFELQSMGRLYAEEPDLNLLDSLGTVLGTQPLLENLDLELRGSLGESVIRESGHFRTARLVGVGLLHQPLRELQLRLFSDFTSSDYYDPAPSEQDRDGNIVRVGLEAAVDLGRGWTVSPYVAFLGYHAEGSDFDGRSVEGGLTIRPEEVLGMQVQLGVAFAGQDYSEPNSLTGFTKKREDVHAQLRLGITFRDLERVIGFPPTLSVTWIDHESNIGIYDYRRWIPQLELGVNLLSF